MISLQLPGFLTLAVAPVVDGDDSEVLFEIFDLMSPDKPELREAVAEKHDGLPPVLLRVDPGLHVVQPHPVDLDVVVATVLGVQQTGGDHTAVLHLEQSQSDQQESEGQPEQAREEEEAPETNSHNPSPLHVVQSVRQSDSVLSTVNSYLFFSVCQQSQCNSAVQSSVSEQTIQYNTLL